LSFERLAFDANAAIDSFRSDRPFPLVLRQARELLLPFFVLAELRLGAARSTRREESAAQVEALASRCRILTAGISTIDFYVRVRDQIERIWTMPQSPQKREGLSHDLWIAALCLENEAPLLTMDKLFDHVEGLRVVHW
jgi:predicted nucleic acid-binding protein